MSNYRTVNIDIGLGEKLSRSKASRYKFPHLRHGLVEKLKNGQTGKFGRPDIKMRELSLINIGCTFIITITPRGSLVKHSTIITTHSARVRVTPGTRFIDISIT